MMVKLAGVGLVSVFGLSAFTLMQPRDATSTDLVAQTPARLVPVETPAVAPAPGAHHASMQPARLLDCELGRITNFDPSKNQKPDDFRFEGRHRFQLFLPPIPVRTTEPPSSTQPPEPVDPRTRVLADPDRLSRGASDEPFYRVVDYWPERVEMTTPIAEEASNLVILDRFDPASRTVNMFMTVANDAVTYDQAHLYAGPCRVTIGDAAAAGLR